MQRAQAAECGIFEVEVQHRKGKLKRNDQPDQQPRDAPEQGRDCTPAHRVVIILRGNRRPTQYRKPLRQKIELVHRRRHCDQRGDADDSHVNRISLVGTDRHRDKGQECDKKPRGDARKQDIHNFSPNRKNCGFGFRHAAAQHQLP